MKHLLLILTISFIALSCQKTTDTKIVEGDLYFKLVDFRLFDLPDTTLSKLEEQAKIKDIDNLSDQGRKLQQHISYLDEKGLLRKPYIRIKDKEDKVVMVFLDSSDYSKIKKYRLPTLREKGKKIRIKVEATEFNLYDFTAFNSTNLVSVKEMDGITESEK